MKKRLDKNPELLSEYNDIINNYENEGIIEKVDVGDYGEVGKVHYLPHRAVVRSDKNTTKVRIVFDASAKDKIVHP